MLRSLPAPHSAAHATWMRRAASPLTAEPASQSLQEWPGWPAMRQMLVDAGGWTHAGLTVATAGGCRGVFVTQALPAGTCLALVPHSCFLTLALADATDAALWQPGGALAAATSRSPDDRLAVHLLLRTRRPADAFAPYLACLPGVEELLATMPVAWSPEQRRALQHPPLEAQVAARLAGCKQQHSLLVAAWPSLGPGPPPSLRELLWAHCIVRSRSLEEASPLLEPLLDLANHAPFSPRLASSAAPRHAACMPTAAAGCDSLVLLRPLQAGEEVLVSYGCESEGGQLDAEIALASFGFLPPDVPGSMPFRDHVDEIGSFLGSPCVLAAQAFSDAVEAALAGSASSMLEGVAMAVRAFGEAMGRETGSEEMAAQAAGRAGSEPARLAARFRQAFALQIARDVLDIGQHFASGRVPADHFTGDGLRLGLAAGAARSCQGDAAACAAAERLAADALTAPFVPPVSFEEVEEELRQVLEDAS